MEGQPFHISKYANWTDEALWKAFKQGDREVFSYLYKTYLDLLFNYGMKVAPDRDLVKDSLQELFIELWKNKQNLSDTRQIRFYLYKALRRKLIREVQKNSGKRFETLTEYTPDQVSFPLENQLISEEVSRMRKARLAKALGKISIRQQELLTLLYFENYSYEQISEMMGIHVKSVYTLAWKAFASLKKSLKDL